MVYFALFQKIVHIVLYRVWMKIAFFSHLKLLVQNSGIKKKELGYISSRNSRSLISSWVLMIYVLFVFSGYTGCICICICISSILWSPVSLVPPLSHRFFVVIKTFSNMLHWNWFPSRWQVDGGEKPEAEKGTSLDCSTLLCFMLPHWSFMLDMFMLNIFRN